MSPDLEFQAFIRRTIYGFSSFDELARAVVSNPSDDYLAVLFNDLINIGAHIIASPYMPIDRAIRILSSPYMPTDRAQALLYTMVKYGYFDRLLQIMTFNASDEVISAGTTYTSGVNLRRNLTINPGVTLTLGTGPGVIIADTLNNYGTIVSGWVMGAGGAPGAPPGKGGDGRGAVIILARNITIGTISADGGDGESGATTDGSGWGSRGGSGGFWVISPDYPPRGGAGPQIAYGPTGYIVSYSAGCINGGGGGGTYNYGSVSCYGADVTQFPSAVSLISELFMSVIDWWLMNVLGKTPTTTKEIPLLGGGGGGGGVDEDTVGDCGGGGGGGGEVIVYGTNVIAGVITARGGKGGNGGTEGIYDNGGGGGGGGVIYVFYKSLSGTFTFDVSGGAGGIGDYNGWPGGDGIARAIQI